MDPVDLDERVAARARRSSARRQRGRPRPTRRCETRGAGRSWPPSKRGASPTWAAQASSARARWTPRSRRRHRPMPQLAAAEAALAAARAGPGPAGRPTARRWRSSARNSACSRRSTASSPSRDAEPGSTVVAGQAVLRLMDPRSALDERAPRPGPFGGPCGRPAGRASRCAPIPRRPCAGTVARVEPISDSVTEERIAKVAFDRLPDGRVHRRAGRSDAAPARRSRRRVVVPNASLRHRAAQTGVWRYADGAARVRAGAHWAQRAWTGRCRCSRVCSAGDAVVVYSERDLATAAAIKVVPALRGAAR